jgi:hypothetical protein
VQKELFKKWAKLSKDFEEFEWHFSFYVVMTEIDPDNCFTDEELRNIYNKYRDKE